MWGVPMLKKEKMIFVSEAECAGLPISLYSACECHCQETVVRAGGAPFYQILFVLGGSGRVRCLGREYPLFKGRCFYVGKGVPIEYFDDGGLFSAFVAVVGEGMGAVDSKYTDCGFLYVDEFLSKDYRHRIAQIVAAYQDGAESGKLSALAYSFFIDFFENDRQKLSAPEEIALYIERNFDRKLTLEHLAQIASLSVSGLCHKFKEQYGITVIEYLIEKRLSYAKNLLLSGENVAIKEVAISSGFDDPSYFCRAYKKYYGITPGEERLVPYADDTK